jgi:uncharacterized damage-inducible protein DinB
MNKIAFKQAAAQQPLDGGNMAKLILTIVMFFIFSAVITTGEPRCAPPSDPRMTPEERAKVVKLMKDSQKEYLDLLANVSDAQWNYKPSPLRWSVGQVAEHIVLVENRIFAIIQRAIAQKPNPDWESKTAGKDQTLERVLPARVGKAQAPLEIQPSGKLSREEVIKRFNEIRAKCLEFAEKTDLPLKQHTFDNPFPVFNTLNAYDWLLYIPFHNLRHDKQIAEVKAASGYPAP